MREVPQPLDTGQSADAASVPRIQRRTLGVLSLAQVMLSGVVALGVPIVVLLAEDITGSPSLAGFSQAAAVVGGVLASVPLARLSSRWGRRAGIATGYLGGAAGALLVVLGGTLRSYPLLLLGPALLGLAVAAGFQSRFGAADLAPAERRGSAIGTVVWAGAIGGVLGPTLFGPLDSLARDVGLPDFTGPYLGVAAGLIIAAGVAFGMLRPDPLLLARSLRGGGLEEAATPPLATRLAALFRNPGARRALAVVASVHAVMLATMNMGSLHLYHGGASVRVVGLVISAHVAGMFLFSPVMGWLTDRLGAYALAWAGIGLQLVSLLILQDTDGSAAVPVGAGLFLVGLGWSAGFVASSALLTASVPAPERPGAQGAFDMLMQAAGAAAALLAGTIVTLWTYPGLARLSALPVLLVAASLAWARRPALSRT
jgi:MFS family permease